MKFSSHERSISAHIDETSLSKISYKSQMTTPSKPSKNLTTSTPCEK